MLFNDKTTAQFTPAIKCHLADWLGEVKQAKQVLDENKTAQMLKSRKILPECNAQKKIKEKTNALATYKPAPILPKNPVAHSVKKCKLVEKTFEFKLLVLQLFASEHTQTTPPVSQQKMIEKAKENLDLLLTGVTEDSLDKLIDLYKVSLRLREVKKSTQKLEQTIQTVFSPPRN